MVTIGLSEILNVVLLIILVIAGIAIYQYKIFLKREHDRKVKELTSDYEIAIKRLEEDAVAPQEAFKKVVEDLYKELDLYQKYIVNISAVIKLTDDKLKELDRLGSFQSDDEIGFFFNNVKEIQTILNDFKAEIVTVNS